MGIILIVAQNLLDMDNLWTGIPSYSSTHEIPVLTFFGGYLFQRRESRNGHHYRTSVLQVHLKLSTFREWQPFDFWPHIPVAFLFILVYSFFVFFTAFRYKRKAISLSEYGVTSLNLSALKSLILRSTRRDRTICRMAGRVQVLRQLSSQERTWRYRQRPWWKDSLMGSSPLPSCLLRLCNRASRSRAPCILAKAGRRTNRQ